MPNPTSKDDVQHMPDEATPEQDDSRKDRQATGPREEPMTEQAGGAPDPEVRDTPLKADRDAGRRADREGRRADRDKDA